MGEKKSGEEGFEEGEREKFVGGSPGQGSFHGGSSTYGSSTGNGKEHQIQTCAHSTASSVLLFWDNSKKKERKKGNAQQDKARQLKLPISATTYPTTLRPSPSPVSTTTNSSPSPLLHVFSLLLLLLTHPEYESRGAVA